MGCCCKSSKQRNHAVLGSGVVIALIGLILALLWTTIFNAILATQLVLSPGSLSFDMWKSTPIPIYLEVYMFNLTNAEEFIKDGWSVKPKLQELGPYVFTEKHDRTNVTWNDNGTVTFKQIRTWHLSPERSKGSLEDIVTTINAVPATVASMVRHKHPVVIAAVNWIIEDQKQTITSTHTVKEYIFEGYMDNLLHLVQDIAAPGLVIPFERFGWFVDRNGSAEFDGEFEIWTGSNKGGFDKLGLMASWNGMSKSTYYPSPCNQIAGGSTGELWPILGTPVPEKVDLFSSDVCSMMTIYHEGSTELFGIEGVRYIGSDSTLDNGTYSTEQSCYATDSQEEWLPHGLRNVSTCRWGAPAYLSFPHLYLADQELFDYLGEGSQKPDPSLHQLYVDLEPYTGLPMRACARAQLNLRLQPVDLLKMYHDAPTFYWPVVWFAQRAELSEDLADTVKLALLGRNLGFYILWAIFGIGLLITLIGLILTFRKKTNNIEETKEIENVTDSTNNTVK